ncbi:unnamed protein product, partial [marine sediment metagenome]
AGGIYKQSSDFITLSQASRTWRGMTIDSGGTVFTCDYGGDIYKQVSGTTPFVALSQTTRAWRDMTVDSGGTVYAIV